MSRPPLVVYFSSLTQDRRTKSARVTSSPKTAVSNVVKKVSCLFTGKLFTDECISVLDTCSLDTSQYLVDPAVSHTNQE